MDACHILLGRPWQFDRNMIHQGKENTYELYQGNEKIRANEIRKVRMARAENKKQEKHKK